MLHPTLGKIVIPILLVGLAFIPSFGLRQTVFGILGFPFAYTFGLPFPYTDKPFFVSPRGAIVIAVFWALLIYIVTSFLTRRRSPTREI
jgi:hypothetical protein